MNAGAAVHRRLSKGEQVAVGVALLAFVAYYVAVMAYRMEGALEPTAVHGDQNQSIGQYWRYALEGAIPPGNLVSDYAFTYHASPFWWVIMATASALLNPIQAAKLLGLVAYLLWGAGVLFVVGRRTHWVLGCLIGMVALRGAPDAVEQITGGMARSMGPSLVCLFLFAFFERRHKLALATLVIQAGVYPAVVIPCAMTYGAWCVFKGPMRDRVRRCTGMFVAGLLIIGLGKAQDLRAPSWWGEPVTYAEAEQMPAWGPQGRFPEVPQRTLAQLLDHNLARHQRALGWSPVPTKVSTFATQHRIVFFLWAPLLVGVATWCLGLWLRRRRAQNPERALDQAEPPAASFPWEVVALFAGSIAAWGLVRLMAFKLFLPSRPIGFVIPYLLVIGVPIIVWTGFDALLPRRRGLVVLLAAALTAVPAFLLLGNSMARTSSGYHGHRGDARLYEAIQKLPLDEEIACDVSRCELMMPLGRHIPFSARNLTHPLRKGYYDEAARRLVEMHRVLFATTGREIADFVRRENVRYFAYDVRSTTEWKASQTFRPVSDEIRAIFRGSSSRARLLANPPPEAIVMRDGQRVLLDLTKVDPELVGAPLRAAGTSFLPAAASGPLPAQPRSLRPSRRPSNEEDDEQSLPVDEPTADDASGAETEAPAS